MDMLIQIGQGAQLIGRVPQGDTSILELPWFPSVVGKNKLWL
jgi:hypothetical protein